MTDKLTEFLTRNHASREVLSRLAATGAATPEETWASWAAAREAQARWLRDNFVLNELNIN